VGTPDATSRATTVPIDDVERRTWLREAGYSGDLAEQVTLLNGAGQPCRTAPATDVWCVRRGLIALRTHHSSLFHRLGNWAKVQRVPRDPEGLLSQDPFGPITHLSSGDWLPGRRELVELMLEPDPEDDVFFRLREQPLARKPQEVAKAA
jgi:hypothetical protein